MDNIIIANFKTGERHKTVYGLQQWNHGQVLRIEGISLPEGTEVHFATPYTEQAPVMLVTIVDDITAEVAIPNQVLVGKGDGKAQSYDILVYIYIEDDVSGQTKYTIRLPVKGRLKPEDYVYTETEVYNYKAIEKKIDSLPVKEITSSKENPVYLVDLDVGLYKVVNNEGMVEIHSAPDSSSTTTYLYGLYGSFFLLITSKTDSYIFGVYFYDSYGQNIYNFSYDIVNDTFENNSYITSPSYSGLAYKPLIANGSGTGANWSRLCNSCWAYQEANAFVLSDCSTKYNHNGLPFHLYGYFKIFDTDTETQYLDKYVYAICYSPSNYTAEQVWYLFGNEKITCCVLDVKNKTYTETIFTDTQTIIGKIDELVGNKITTPTTATVGQVLTVKSVDENGVPTEWEYAEAGGDVDVDAELKEYYTTQKTQLAENIRYKGVETSTEDSLGVLVGKVLDIPSAVEPTETIPEQTTLIANALQETLGIELVWSDVGASGYLILRKENFAPTSTADGTVVYDGPELTYTDTDVERDKQYYYRIFPYNDLHQYQATEDRAIVFVDYVDRSGQKTIGDLVLGDIVKFGQFGTSLFTWKIVDTLDKQSGYVTVAAEQALGNYQFDAPENDTDNPNTVTNRKNQGNNRWSFSNIRQFLNSDAEAGEWYVAQHDYDVAPSYKTQAPFLNAFTDFEKEIIVKKTNKCVLDSADGGGSETVIDKIWLASSYAMGLEVFQPLEDDHVYESFVDNTSRAFQSNYWLRTINGTTSASGVRFVGSSGALGYNTASSNFAVRPFCCLPTSAYVYWSDSDSAYVFADDSQRNLATEE